MGRRAFGILGPDSHSPIVLSIVPWPTTCLSGSRLGEVSARLTRTQPVVARNATKHMAGASNLQREAYDYENGLLTNHLALVQIFIDGTANGLSWFGLFLSIRATLPVLNGLVLPKAPEAVTDQLVPFLRITCDRYLSIFQRIFPYNINGVDLAVFPAFVCTLPTPLKAAQLSRTLADFSLSTSHTNKHTQMHTRTRTRSTEPFAAALNCSCRSFPSLISLFTFVRFFLATSTLSSLSRRS